jgi:hypothetical protein
MTENNNKIIYYWFGVFTLCFLCFQAISSYIRPNYTGVNIYIKYLLGIAPNFFPAIGIPALFVALIPQMKLTNSWLNEKKHIAANIISLSGLVLWECIQTSSKKLYFDWNDILWTCIGAIVFQVIWSITPDRYKEKDKRK